MSFLDSAINWLKDSINTASDTVQSWSTEWQSAVDNFKTKARNFVSMYETLETKENIASKDPKIKADYDNLMSKGRWIYNVIADIAKKLDFFNDTLGTNKLNSMGALPLVPIAIIAGAVAVITAWMADALILSKKLDVIERLAGQGTDPVQLADKLKEGESGLPGFSAITGGFQKLLLLGIVGVVLYNVWPTLRGNNE